MGLCGLVPAAGAVESRIFQRKGTDKVRSKQAVKWTIGITLLSLLALALAAVYSGLVAAPSTAGSDNGREVADRGNYSQEVDDSDPDLVLDGSSSTDDNGNLWSGPSYASSDLQLFSNDDVNIHIDENDDEAGDFVVLNGANEQVLRVDEAAGWYGSWVEEESDTAIHSRDNLHLYLNDDNAGTKGAVTIYDGSGNNCLTLDDDGNIYKYCGGTSSAVIDASDGSPRRLYVIESPEVWLEDFGFGKLENGVATVGIEPLFLGTINTEFPYHVFLTPLGDCNGLYVAGKAATSFEVRELGGGTSEVEFEYRVIAKRQGWEDARMEPAPIEGQGRPAPGTEADG
jgi:hypothetical protein